jgi:L-ascorbate metabolism protein UlaG (beta-lactamase superfamily)
MVTIRYLGQSGFELSDGSSTLLIDPSNRRSGELNGNFVYCTHNHSDHIRGVESFLEVNEKAKLIGNEQVLEKFPNYQERSILSRQGERLEVGPWTLEFIKNRHGLFRSVLNLGAIIGKDEFSFGHPGDCVRFSGFYNRGLQYMAVPISGGFTASPRRALDELMKFGDPKPIIIPIHWLFRNPNSFCHKLRKNIEGIICQVPETGQTL